MLNFVSTFGRCSQSFCQIVLRLWKTRMIKVKYCENFFHRDFLKTTPFVKYLPGIFDFFRSFSLKNRHKNNFLERLNIYDKKLFAKQIYLTTRKSTSRFLGANLLEQNQSVFSLPQHVFVMAWQHFEICFLF
jgi:hypothetical protein